MTAESQHLDYAEKRLQGTLIEAEVPIIYTQLWGLQHWANLAMHGCVVDWKGYPIVWLIAVPHHLPGTSIGDGIQMVINAIAEQAPKHRCVIACNTPEDVQECERRGFSGLLINQNQFVDRRSFRPVDCNRMHDAVLNSSFLPLKRHELAVKVPSLALISYTTEPELVQRVEGLLPNATYANRINGAHRWLEHNEINDVYNQAYCGLILSYQEGANYATMEYLLAGLPVVTTVSVGGRDRYLDGRFCSWVDADPDAVAQAVYNYKRLNIDPQFIRNETIRKIDADFSRTALDVAELLRLDPSKTSAAFNCWRGHGFIQSRTMAYITDRLRAVYN